MNARFLGLVGALSCAAYAQTGSIAGPTAGYVFDPSVKALRQIRGIPGAATMGDAIFPFGMSMASAEISPRGDSAIVVAVDGSVHLFRLKDGGASEQTVDNLLTPAAKVVYSPSGTSAALVGSGSTQVVRGLPDAPAVAMTVSRPAPRVAMMIAGVQSRTVMLDAVAVSDDGELMLLAGERSVELISSAAGRKLADAQTSAVLAFAPGSHDAAVVSGGKLTVFRDLSGAGTTQDFPNAAAPAGLAFSADGSRVVMAGPRAATVLDRATGARQTVTYDFQPSRLSAMGSFFRLNEVGSGPLWLLDPAGEAKLVFIPARHGL
jgi:hypothetical protein